MGFAFTGQLQPPNVARHLSRITIADPEKVTRFGRRDRSISGKENADRSNVRSAKEFTRRVTSNYSIGDRAIQPASGELQIRIARERNRLQTRKRN